MSFFGALLQGFGVLALDVLSALLNGPKPVHQGDLKNKDYGSDAYGNPWDRCRGTVRLPGKVIWGTKIQTSIHKTTSGGIFGIGQQSVYYNTYSVSVMVGYGKKLGGGPATAILRVWTDGKFLFNSVVSSGSITGSVTVTVISGGQPAGTQAVSLTLASGASLNLNAGDQIIFAGQPGVGYEVQVPVSATGPATIFVSIWPPLSANFSGGGAVTIAGLTSSPYDLSSFDPDPHDGSHPSGGFIAPPGGMVFYLGSDTQPPDPHILFNLGTGNVPGYRGLVCTLIHNLELANYGNRIPQFSGEIAFDTASGQFPVVGPIAGVGLQPSFPGYSQVVLPFAGTSSLLFSSPLQTLPYSWAVNVGGGGIDIHRINTQTNLLEASYNDPTNTIYGPAVADPSGFIYYVRAIDLNRWSLFKVDGLAMTAVVSYGGGVAYQENLSDPSGIYCFDSFPSLFGIPLQVSMIATMAVFGGIIFLDRKYMLPMGTANPGGSFNVITGYNSNGTPIFAVGDVLGSVGTPYSGGGAEIAGDAICVDLNGDIWTFQEDTLSRYDCQFHSSIYFDSFGLPHPYLAPPTFARTDYNIGASVGNGGGAIYYYFGDNSIIVFGASATGKFDVATASIIATNPVVLPRNTVVTQDIDVMGTIIMGYAPTSWRVDASTLTVTSSYNMTNWGLPAGPGKQTYDQTTDSLWWDESGLLYRAYLDRGNGSGVGLDSIVSSLMNDAGYDPSQYDVTRLTAAGITCYGVEFTRQSFLDSLRMLMQLYLFDAAEIDGKIVFVPRGQASVVTIPESDLGALDDPSKYEPRVVEPIQDPQATPESVHIHYYDPLRQDQQSVQYAKRISKPYPSSLASGKPVTSSRQQLDITSSVTENATPIKHQADKILWDGWAGRPARKLKLGPKYIRLDPTDVVTLAYKSLPGSPPTVALLETRLEEVNFGAKGAIELTGKNQDSSVYSNTFIPAGSSGSGTITPPTQPPITNTNNNYTISPASPLSEVSATDVHMVDVTAMFSSGLRTLYNARDFTVIDPASLSPAVASLRYYVTIHDPNFTGEIPGTVSLAGFCDTDPALAHVGVNGYIFMGTILVTHSGVGVIVTAGGSGNTAQAIGFYVNGTGGTPTPSGVQIDLLTYLVNSQRATMHLTGSAANSPSSNIYSYLDPTTSSVAQIKSSAGWAADIQLYDAASVPNAKIYQFITELADPPPYNLWSDPSSYKKYVLSGGRGYPKVGPLPIMPRFITPGAAIPDIVIASPTDFNRYTACGLIDTINRGQQTCRNYGPIMMNFDSDGTVAGNLGNISVMVHERYAGNSRERMYWALNLGFVKWDAGTLISGAPITGQYAITNWSVHNKLVSGGGVTPSFACGYGAGWP